MLSKFACCLGWFGASALCGALLYLFVIGVLCVPATRTLRVDVRARTGGVLRVAPDVGRGFFESDAAYLRIDPPAVRDAASVLQVEVPFVAKKIRFDLTSSDHRAALGAVYAVTKQDSRLLQPAEPPEPREPRPTTQVLAAPALAEEVPALAQALAALCGVSSTLGLSLRGHAVRRRMWVAWRCVARSGALVSLRGISTIGLSFGALVLALSISADVYHLLVRSIDNPPYWPISIFEPARPSTWSALLALVVAGAAYVGSRHVSGPRQAVHRLGTLLPADARLRPRANLIVLLALGLLILGVTNSIHGWSAGYVEPTDGSQAYLADAKSIDRVSNFIRDYTAAQPSLRTHSRTHPPGAVLTYYALSRLTADAGLMSLAMGTVSFLATSLCVFAILRSRTNQAAALAATWLFMLTPAVQIYFISCLDALVCASFTATLVLFLHQERYSRLVGTAVGLVMSMWLTFAAVFLWAMLFLYDVVVRRSVKSFVIVSAAVILVHLFVYVSVGFNWVESFGIAARLENPRGFSLLDNPGTYFFTRLEGVAEMVLFASPLLVLVCCRSLVRPAPRLRDAAILCVLAVAVLALMLVSGAYKTGETARACLFIYPILVLPTAALFESGNGLSRHQQLVFFNTVGAQFIIMQLFGNYYW